MPVARPPRTSSTAPSEPAEAAGATSLVRAQDATEADWLRAGASGGPQLARAGRRGAHGRRRRAALAGAGDARGDRADQRRPRAARRRLRSCRRRQPAPDLRRRSRRPDRGGRASTPPARPSTRPRIALGGTITGEHGTGIAKRAYLEAQLGAARGRGHARGQGTPSTRRASSTRARCSSRTALPVTSGRSAASVTVLEVRHPRSQAWTTRCRPQGVLELHDLVASQLGVAAGVARSMGDPGWRAGAVVVALALELDRLARARAPKAAATARSTTRSRGWASLAWWLA